MLVLRCDQCQRERVDLDEPPWFCFRIRSVMEQNGQTATLARAETHFCSIPCFLSWSTMNGEVMAGLQDAQVSRA